MSLSTFSTQWLVDQDKAKKTSRYLCISRLIPEEDLDSGKVCIML